MQVKIFYSWQSDSDLNYNRYFLEKCIKEALKIIGNDNEYKLLYEFDRDTQGILGTVEITDTIFEKIKACHIFVADISIINNSKDEDDQKVKLTPNPNVLLELGFAASQIGWENTICFFNESYCGVERLPFDLRNRRPYIYKIGSDTSNKLIKEKKKKIASDLVKIITQMSPHLVDSHREVMRRFHDSSFEIRRIVQNKPKRWIEILAYEFLKDEVRKINKINNNIEEGYTYRPTKVLTGQEFYLWTRASNENIMRLLKMLEKVKDFMPKTYEEVEEDLLYPITLKDSIQRLSSVCLNVLEWRIILDSILPPEELENLKLLLMDWHKPFVEFMNQLNDRLGYVIDKIRGLTDIKQPGVVKVSLGTLPHLSQVHTELANWMINNPDEII